MKRSSSRRSTRTDRAALGTWRLSELRPERLEAHYRRMQTDGHSTNVVRAVHRVLRSALNEAVRRRRLGINPALVARPPRTEHVEVEPLSVEESRRVLAAAHGTQHPARWSIALSLGPVGLRRCQTAKTGMMCVPAATQAANEGATWRLYVCTIWC